MSGYIVIGASSDIGREVSSQLESQGYSVFKTARTTSRIEPDMILNAVDFDQVDHAFAAAKDKIGVILGVVNCAGSLLLKPAHLTNFDQYQEVVQSSLTTSFAVARAAGKHMKEGGSVVFISSAAAIEGLANHDAIAAAKAGVIGLALSCAASYASANLRFNVVAPGLVDTSLTKAITGSETSRKFSENMHALGRIGTPKHIANAVTFLLNPENDWITGQVLGVDGGLSRVRPKARA